MEHLSCLHVYNRVQKITSENKQTFFVFDEKRFLIIISLKFELKFQSSIKYNFRIPEENKQQIEIVFDRTHRLVDRSIC